MANEEHLAILKQGVDVWNKWREENIAIFPDLNKAQLDKTDLHGINLIQANCYDTSFGDSDLSEAKLIKANLMGVNFQRTNLRRANLRATDIRYANLIEANLTEADLEAATIRGTELYNADFTKCIFGNTIIGMVDLSNVKGLETIEEYIGSSTIGIETIYLSKGKISEKFLRGCGVPENFITFMHSLTGSAFDFYSCFISHSIKDKHFCDRLYADFQAKGVRTWYFPEDAKWGEPVWGEIDRSIKIYDKLVVVLSKNSLQSNPVQREIERALNREDKEGKDILFPIRIDDYVFNGWEHQRKADILRKVVGDFTEWDSNVIKYNVAFQKLLNGLKAVNSETTG